jgi:hypothetical protein
LGMFKKDDNLNAKNWYFCKKNKMSYSPKFISSGITLKSVVKFILINRW